VEIHKPTKSSGKSIIGRIQTFRTGLRKGEERKRDDMDLDFQPKLKRGELYGKSKGGRSDLHGNKTSSKSLNEGAGKRHVLKSYWVSYPPKRKGKKPEPKRVKRITYESAIRISRDLSGFAGLRTRLPRIRNVDETYKGVETRGREERSI